ncbi:MAG: hypothetical protein M3P18_10750, partial [Actinomycetota bacterium]|nr:hypothetical protein [Actinomycetota bacterium]
GRPALQQLVGARGQAVHDQLLFFTGGGYSAAAVAYAHEMGIALLQYSLDGSMTALNPLAARLIENAVPPGGRTAERPGAQPELKADGGLKRFWKRNWRAIIGVWFLLGPFGTL